MNNPTLEAQMLCKADEKPIRIKDLFAYLDEWRLPFEVFTGVDAKSIGEILGIAYPWQASIVGPTKYTEQFDGTKVSHFITIADNLVVWAVFGSYADYEGGPDYDLFDFAVRVK